MFIIIVSVWYVCYLSHYKTRGATVVFAVSLEALQTQKGWKIETANTDIVASES